MKFLKKLRNSKEGPLWQTSIQRLFYGWAKFDDEVERVSLRTITGDLAIMAHHINYCTAVGMGTAKVIMKDGSERKAACIGGMLS